MKELYLDDNVKIHTSDNKLFFCTWMNPKKDENKSYMEAKIVEVISNKFSGAWPVKNLEEAKTSRGLKCFTTEWEDSVLKARWI